MMKRREFVTLLGGAAACLWALRAILTRAPAFVAFQQRLRELGWSEDRNMRIDVVWGAGDADHVSADAAELVRKSPDVILANGPVPTIEIAKATHAIPIVFAQVPDPVDLGIVTSIARPGGNIKASPISSWRSGENGSRRSRRSRLVLRPIRQLGVHGR